ncbi:MAG: S41 family peptidase [candidate division WOR-3 bacterium]|nr:MAG: S41 family peptidase [candidate division WOR-3 bacterium]
MKRRVAVIVAASVASAVLGGVFGRLWAGRGATLHQSLQLFSRVVRIVMSSYVENVEPAELIKAGIEGMLESLDPHTNFLDEADFGELRVRTDAQFGGIGIHIGMVDDRLTVINPIEGTPAERAGVKAGDRIAEIEGESTEGFTTEDAVRLLRGTPGTQVAVGLDRPGVNGLIPIDITRAIINIAAVPYAGILGDGIGYIRLADFSRVASRELSRAMDSLFGVGARKLIFDVRRNGGGLLEEGREVSDLFLDRGKVIVKTDGRIAESKREFFAESPLENGEYPLVVLVDQYSASAAEIVAGAIQDWERGLILGDTTFGKGSVQTIHQLGPQVAVKITTAYWYTPSGRCINLPRDQNGEEQEPDENDARSQKGDYLTLGPLRRHVYGGGAIAPDVYLPYEEMSELEMSASRALFDFAVDYVNENSDLDMDFVADDGVLAELRDYLKDVKELEFDDAEFDSSRDYFVWQIEREVGSKLEGVRGGYQLQLRRDPHVKKALELLASVETNEELLSRLQ